MIGRTARLEKTLTAEEIRAFSVLTGDMNPLHLSTKRRPLAQGALLSALGATLVGTELPGPGSIYLSQTFEYLLPVFAEDKLEIRGEVIAYEEDERRCTIAIRCRNDAEELVMQGTMIVQRAA